MEWYTLLVTFAKEGYTDSELCQVADWLMEHSEMLPIVKEEYNQAESVYLLYREEFHYRYPDCQEEMEECEEAIAMWNIFKRLASLIEGFQPYDGRKECEESNIELPLDWDDEEFDPLDD